MVWGHPAVLLFWWQLCWKMQFHSDRNRCLSQSSSLVLGWKCFRHPKSHTWLFPVFRGMEQWVTLLGLGDIHLQISFLISLYLSFLFIQVGSEKQHLPASHHIHIHCCWGGFTTAAGKVSDQSCTLKCQSFGYLFIHKAHRSSQACHSEQTQHKAHSNSTWRCLHKGQLLINEWISHSVKHISVLHKL